MPKKDTDNTPTDTAIKLLVFLLENERGYSLTRLAERFNVSKQTIIRTLERHDLSFFGRLVKETVNRESVYRLDKSNLLKRLVRAASGHGGHNKILLCKAFGEKFTSQSLIEEIVGMEIRPKNRDERYTLAMLKELHARGII